MQTSTEAIFLARPRQGSERGVALILGMFLTIVGFGLVVSGSAFMKAYRSKTDVAFISSGQARQFARAGLTEALGWMRLQSSQPVLAFAPVLDNAATPKVLETIEPDIGLVREFQVSGAVWGRYEVWKQWDADPDPSRLAWRQKMQATDVSMLRNNPKPGSVWRVRSVGYVFRRVDANKTFDEYPNQIIGVEILETEMRRLSLIPPGAGALTVRDGAVTDVKGKGRVKGGKKGAGVVYPQGKSEPPGQAKGTVTGTPASSPTPVYEDSTEAVFNATLEELRAMADVAITKQSDFPSPIPENTIIHSVIPYLTLDSTQPLEGFGVVYHVGDLILPSGNNCNFSGLLYVDGNITIDAPAEIQGTVVVTGSITVDGTSDFSNLTYDEDVLKALEEIFGRYRFSSPIRNVNAR